MGIAFTQRGMCICGSLNHKLQSIHTVSLRSRIFILYTLFRSWTIFSSEIDADAQMAYSQCRTAQEICDYAGVDSSANEGRNTRNRCQAGFARAGQCYG